IAIDASGNIYVTDEGNDRVKRYGASAPANSSGGSGTTAPYVTAAWGSAKQATWGSSTSANGQFYDPTGAAVDANGNVYVSEYSNHRIQKFTSSGTFSLVWGSSNPASGSTDGYFSNPTQMAVDSQGYVYVADYGNHRIQKFLPNGGFAMSWGSAGTTAGKFDNPWGVAVDTTSGYVYVADTDNHRIQKFTSSGTFLLTWGSNGSSNGTFSYPFSIAVDGLGLIYVADRNNHRIQKFTEYGVLVSSWGSYGTSGASKFNYPYGIAVDRNLNVYVADRNNHRIQKFDANGSYLTEWGSNGTGQEHFDYPTAIAIDASGNIYVTDEGNDRVKRYGASAPANSSGGSGTTAPSLNLLFGIGGTSTGTFQGPKSVAVDSSGNIYVADTTNNRIQKFDATGGFAGIWGSTTASSANGYFNGPRGMAVSTAGWIYVADEGNDRIQVLNADGSFRAGWGSSGSESGKFSSPWDVALDTTTGDVYVLDGNNYHIQKFNSTGTFKMSWGAAAATVGHLSTYYSGALSVDGLGFVYLADYSNHRVQKFNPFGVAVSTWGSYGTSAGQFNYPEGIVVDKDLNVYVADTSNSRIQKFGATGSYLTSWGASGSAQDAFSLPMDLAVDGSGNLYVAESGNNRVKRYGTAPTNSYGGSGVSTPVVTAIWGGAGASTGSFSSPYGITVDTQTGNVYVADAGNARIQKFTAGGGYLTNWVSSATSLVLSGGVLVAVDRINSSINTYDLSGALLSSNNSHGISGPYGIASDTTTGVIYVADTANSRILKVTSSGTFVMTWGGTGGSLGRTGNPRQIAVDGFHNIYMVDASYEQIQKFNPYGVALSTWGGNGTGTGRFNSPQGVAVDRFGSVYIADTSNHRIQKFDGNGAYLTSWGQSGTGWDDLSSPKGLAIASDGSLYVVDSGNDRVKRYSLYNLGLAPYVAAVTSSTVRLEWTAAANSSYTVAAAQDLGFSNVVSSGTVFSTYTVVTGLTELTSYYFVVKFSSDTDSYYNTPIVTMTARGDITAPSGAPGTPTDDGVWVGTTSLMFYWSAGNAADSESGIAGYYLRVFTSTKGFIFQSNVGNVTTYTVTGASSGQTYYASVQAINGTGFYSSYSSTSDGITVELTAPTGSLSTPTASASFINSSTTISFSWTQGSSTDAESGLSGYYLQIGTASGSTSIYDGYLGNILSTTVAAGLTEGSTYYARVRAKNGAGLYGDYTGYSDGVTVDLTVPSAPSSMTSTSHPSTGTAYPSTTATFIISTAGVVDASGISGFYWSVAASSASAPTVSSGTYASSPTVTVSNLQSDGIWYFLAVCVDRAGNVGTQAYSFAFRVKVSVDPNANNTFTNSDGVIVEIPAGAVTSSTTISIQTSTAPTVPQDTMLKASGVIRDIKLANGTTKFNKSVTVTLPYATSDIVGLTESKLKLFFYDATDNYWALIPNSSVNTTSRTVSGAVDHFTIFQIMEFTTPESALTGVSNYPNPFSPLKKQTTKIRYTLDSDRAVVIRIYDPYGGLVWDDAFAAAASGGRMGPNEVTWDGKTPDGRYAAADAYICLIDAGGTKGKRIIGVK
ncbi:MAG: hypothetical protein HY547_10090, partial [Elusimicrobia bacterium]|nr:hypothetical protein [Elusimicrobiota bacterium]